MPKTPDDLLQALKAFGLSLPGTEPKSPWPGHDDVAVRGKTVAFMSLDGGAFGISMKLPASGPEALKLPGAAPTGYGLGRSGWVSLKITDTGQVALDQLKHWMLESYRAQAPKKLWNELEAAQPWLRMGGLPDEAKAAHPAAKAPASTKKAVKAPAPAKKTVKTPAPAKKAAAKPAPAKKSATPAKPKPAARSR